MSAPADLTDSFGARLLSLEGQQRTSFTEPAPDLPRAYTPPVHVGVPAAAVPARSMSSTSALRPGQRIAADLREAGGLLRRARRPAGSDRSRRARGEVR